MNGETEDREVILACVIELLDVIDENGDGEITREEFVCNGMKSGFIRNLMEFFDDDPDISKLDSKEPTTDSDDDED